MALLLLRRWCQTGGGKDTHSQTDSFLLCSRLRLGKNDNLMGFFLKISYEDSVMHSLLLRTRGSAAGVCRDVWVGTACEHSDELTQPRLPLEVAPGAETTCPSKRSLLFRLWAQDPNHPQEGCHLGSKHAPFSSPGNSLEEAKESGRMRVSLPVPHWGSKSREAGPWPGCGRC